MKNHFYIAYAGNKRNEAKDVYDNLNFDNITTIIEPYCGSCALSYYISTKKTGLKYILNDNNKYLYQMYELMKDDTKIEQFEKDYKNLFINLDKEKYNELVKKDDLLYWFLKNKYFCIRPGIYPLESRKCSKEIKLKEVPIYNFFKNEDIIFTTENGLDCYKKYKDNEQNILLLDPPYLDSCNNMYLDPSVQIYEYLYYNNINKENAKIYLILENIWIIKLLFKENKILLEYSKKYEMSKKKTSHIIIYNK